MGRVGMNQADGREVDTSGGHLRQGAEDSVSIWIVRKWSKWLKEGGGR